MPNTSSILIVDDNEMNREFLHDTIEKLGHTPILAENGISALSQIRKHPPDLVLLDILMPEMDGYEVLDRIKIDNNLRHIPIIMVSAVDQMKSVIQCIKKGADDYLTKPFNSTLLKARIYACLEKKRLHDAERELLDKTLNGSIEVLTEILSLVAPTAFSRTSRLKHIARHIAKQLKLSDIWQIELAAMLSQIGCITLPPDILEKIYAGQDLSSEENKMFVSHPAVGHDLLTKIPRLKSVAQMIGKQQETFDVNLCSDEPRKRDFVTVGGQILKVAIEFDKLTIRGMSFDDAIAHFLESPKEFDYAIVVTLKELKDYDAVMEIKTETIANFYPGMVLDQDIYDKDVLIMAKGQEITLYFLKRLRRIAELKGIVKPIRVLVPPK